MNVETLREFKQKNSFTYPQLAVLFGVSPSAVQHWYLGVRAIPGPVVILMRLYNDQPKLMKTVFPDF